MTAALAWLTCGVSIGWALSGLHLWVVARRVSSEHQNWTSEGMGR